MTKIKPYTQVYKGVVLFPTPAIRNHETNEIEYLTQEALKKRIDFVLWNRQYCRKLASK